jgi:hypothetical protein
MDERDSERKEETKEEKEVTKCKESPAATAWMFTGHR